MSGLQITAVTAAFLILIAITLAAQFRKPHRYLIFAAGVAIVVALRIANLPPSWFDGTATGFVLGFSLLLGGFVAARSPAERPFGQPLLDAMGFTLLAMNGVAWALARW